MKKNTLLPYILLSLFWLFPSISKSQRYGLPGIRNYTHAEYNAGTQNWSVAQAENDMIYFANNSGLVEFDGAHWKLYPTDVVIRALCIDNDKVYTGAFNEFGFYQADASGMMKYHSLKHLLGKQIKDFDEIWRIHKTSFGIVFQSFKAIFIYNQGKINIIYPRSKFHFSYYVNGILWVFDEEEGLMQYREGKVRQISGGDFFKNTQIWTILPLNDDQVLIGTEKKGVFKYDGTKVLPWNAPVNELLKKFQIYSGSVIDNKYLAFGTIQNGIVITDTAGKVIFQINKDRGLLNNTVLCVGNDKEGNIWLGLDNGIALVNFNSPLTYIQNYFEIGSGYASVRAGEYLYLGTNQGLFCIKWSDFVNPLKKREDFRLIEGTEGQVWNLSLIDNTLFCGHHLGVFEITGNNARRISTVPGGWSFLKLNTTSPMILVGNYTGISILEKKGNQWIFRSEVQGYNQSSRHIEQDENGYLWISHGYIGIYRLKLDSDFNHLKEIKLYNSKNGLPSAEYNILYRIKSGIVIATRKGIYRYNPVKDSFVPDNEYSRIIPGLNHIEYLFQDNNLNLWYIMNLQPGVMLWQYNGSYKNVTAPFNPLKNKLILSSGHINILDNNNVIFGLEGGFGHYYPGHYKNYSFVPALYISDMHSVDTAEGAFRYNSTLGNQKIIPQFKFRNNTISFTYAANHFSESGIEYQILLSGFDKNWSDWSAKNTKEYTNLPFGDYTFELKARLDDGTSSPVLLYKFSISPPWYFSTIAWIIYFLLALAFAYFMYWFYLRSIEKSRLKEKEQQRIKYRQREQQFKEEALEAEREMIRLRSEKLNLEMIHKEKELANSTMMIIQKNEMLNKLMLDLNKVKTALPDEQHKNELNVTLKRIGKEIDNEKQWQVFNTHVEQVHEDLFRKLKELYPDLTPREISLCAYLRMNISSKEIATLMNISTRGVEISRYRIRKKLGIDRNANLTDFMMKL